MKASTRKLKLMFLALTMAALALAVFGAVPVWADATVDDDGGADYTTIQAAIDAASDGDTITVNAGTYTETLDLKGKQLTIDGAGAADTVVDASSFSGYAVSNFGDSTTIQDLKLIGSDDYGFKVSHVSDVTLNNIKVEDSGKTGVDLNTVITATLSNIEVVNTVSGFGIMILDSNNVDVSDITTNNNPWGGVSVHAVDANAENISFSGTFDAGEDVPLLLEKDPPYAGDFVNVDIPSKFEYVVYGERETSEYRQWYYQETLDDAKMLANALATSGDHTYIDLVIYDTPEENYYVTPELLIQDAIDAASADDTVNVAAGTYAEDVILNKNVDLAGAGSSQLTLNGTLNLGNLENVTVSGITIENDDYLMDSGYGTTIFKNVEFVGMRFVETGDIDRPIYFGYDHGVSVTGQDGLLFEDCEFEGYMILGSFGGEETGGPIVFDDVTLESGVNTYGGTSVTVKNSTTQNGGYFYLSGITDLLVEDNIFTGSGGTFVNGADGADILRNVFQDVTEYPALALTAAWGPTQNYDVSVVNNTFSNISTDTIKIYNYTDSTPDSDFLEAHSNSFSGVGGFAVNSMFDTFTVDASTNWWGSADPAGVSDNISGTVDFTPLIDDGTDTDTNTPGFQPDLSSLTVHTLGEQTGTTGRIQEGIDEVSGSTVNVAPGTYEPPSTINIDKAGLTLQGPQAGVDPRPSEGSSRTPGDASEAVIDGDPSSLGKIIYIDADDITINGLEVKSGTEDMIRQSDTHSGTVVKYCIIHDGQGDEGVQLKKATNAMLEYNYVFDIANPGDGLNISDDSSNGVIRYNEVHDIGSENAAIYVYGSTDMEILHNLVYSVPNNDGIKLGTKGGDDATLSGGTIQDNVIHDTAQDGISVYMSGVTVSGNEVYNSSSENGAIYVAFDVSNITITENLVYDNALATTKHGDAAGILVGKDVNASSVSVNDNCIYDNTPYGVTNHATDELDATYNWWGAASGPGPVGPGSGDKVSDNVDYDPWLTGVPTGTLQAVIDAASPGDTIYLGPYTYEGGVAVDKELTIIGVEGTVITPGSHGMTVSANDVTIDGITFDGDECTSGSGDAGIYVQNGVERLVIRNCEVKNWCDGGIRFAGSSTDVKIVDNYVHDNEKSGLSIDQAPAGTVDVYGNAFRNNGDNGVFVSSGSLTATYNEWGDVEGPDGPNGDGVSADVTYDPWVFGKLWVEPASPTVRETELVTAYVKMDVHHLYGTSFALSFDESVLQLTEKPSIGDFETETAGASFDTNALSDINDTGTITFKGYRASGDDEYDATDDVLLTLPFQAQEISGISQTVDLAFEPGTKMGAKGGVNIYIDSVTDGEIKVLGTTTVDGVVDLQGRSDDSGAVVDPQAGESYSMDPDPVTTGSWGAYAFSDMTDDTYTVTIEMERYLDASASVSVSGDDQTLNTVTLLGGDANDDDVINISDMTIIGGEYGNEGADITEEGADINADDVVDILDLVLAAGNYGLTESPWSL